MIKIKTQASSYPVTLDDCRWFIKHTDDTDSAEITLVSNMLKAAHLHVEKMCNLSLSEKTFIEHFEPAEDGLYELSIRPFSEMVSVKMYDVDEKETLLTLNSDYYAKGLYERVIDTAALSKQSTLRVEYKAGYGTDNTEICPEDIRQAIMKQVFHWYENRDEYLENVYSFEIRSIIKHYTNIL